MKEYGKWKICINIATGKLSQVHPICCKGQMNQCSVYSKFLYQKKLLCPKSIEDQWESKNLECKVPESSYYAVDGSGSHLFQMSLVAFARSWWQQSMQGSWNLPMMAWVQPAWRMREREGPSLLARALSGTLACHWAWVELTNSHNHGKSQILYWHTTAETRWGQGLLITRDWILPMASSQAKLRSSSPDNNNPPLL